MYIPVSAFSIQRFYIFTHCCITILTLKAQPKFLPEGILKFFAPLRQKIRLYTSTESPHM